MNDFVFETFTETSNTAREKTRWLDYSYGTHIVRILTPPKRVFTHFFKGKGTIQCLGKDCPVCKMNKQLEVQYPDDYRNQRGYVPSSPRHYTNVLDRTMVKVCPDCGAESTKDQLNQFPNTCKCGTMINLVEPTRSDKVKLANISETNAQSLNALNQAVLDEQGNPRGLGNFDIAFLVTASKGKKNIAVSATNNFDVINVPEDALYDLSSPVIKLEPDEIMQFMRGVSLKDIFAARKAEHTPEHYNDEPPFAVDAKIVESLEDEFKALGFEL